MNIRAIALLLAATAALLAGGHAAAQAGYPSRPITLVVPQAAGGTNDIVGRVVGQKIAEVLGASVVVDNRPGAGGNIGTAAGGQGAEGRLHAAHDHQQQPGHQSRALQEPGLRSGQGLPTRGPDRRGAQRAAGQPVVPGQVRSASCSRSRSARTRAYQYASAGNGTLNHLLGEMLNSMAGIQLQHVPYKGVAPAINDVLGGQLPIVFASLPSALPHIKAGKLRALAVSGDKRSPVLPDVPAIAESVPGYNGTLWIGLFAPAGMPQDVLAKLQDATQKAMAAPDLREKLDQQGVEIAPPTSPEQFAKLLQDDIAKWARIVKASGAAVD